LVHHKIIVVITVDADIELVLILGNYRPERLRVVQPFLPRSMAPVGDGEEEFSQPDPTTRTSGFRVPDEKIAPSNIIGDGQVLGN